MFLSRCSQGWQKTQNHSNKASCRKPSDGDQDSSLCDFCLQKVSQFCFLHQHRQWLSFGQQKVWTSHCQQNGTCTKKADLEKGAVRSCLCCGTVNDSVDELCRAFESCMSEKELQQRLFHRRQLNACAVSKKQFPNKKQEHAQRNCSLQVS